MYNIMLGEELQVVIKVIFVMAGADEQSVSEKLALNKLYCTI